MYARPDMCTPVLVDTLGGTGESTDLAIGFHLIWIPRPTRIVGYGIYGLALTGESYRIWIVRSHRLTLLPYGPAIENSDTLKRIFDDTTPKIRDGIMVPAPAGGALTRFVHLQLPNPVDILVPGLYYIGIARTKTLGTGEKLFGSYHPGYLRGMRDLMSTLTVASSTLNTFDPATLATLDLDVTIANQDFEFPSSDYTVARLCNTDVRLLAVRFRNG